jgi:hypothetical protein
VPSLAEVVRRYGGAYLARFGAAVPREHRKVLRAIAACRTGELGTVVYACSACGARHRTAQSCGNRHCPTCQHHKGQSWLQSQQQRLLPCPYFLISFTLPAELRRFVRHNQRLGYGALFSASSSALKSVAANPRWVGTPQAGFFGVLHTWGRTLEYHPHVHYVVPGGGPSADGSAWMPSRPDFFVPERALSRIYRARFREVMRAAGLLKQIDPAAWSKDWVVKAVAVGDGSAALKYLAAYVFRVAIGDHRILSLEDGHVTFTYRKSGSRRWRRMRLEATEFLRRFLQHVLPCGFQKVRHYGYLRPGSRRRFEAVRWLATLHAGQTFVLQSVAPAAPPPNPIRPLRPHCADCGGELHFLVALRRRGRALFDTS